MNYICVNFVLYLSLFQSNYRIFFELQIWSMIEHQIWSDLMWNGLINKDQCKVAKLASSLTFEERARLKSVAYKHLFDTVASFMRDTFIRKIQWVAVATDGWIVKSKESTKVICRTFIREQNFCMIMLRAKLSEDKTVMEGHKSDGMLRLAEIIH